MDWKNSEHIDSKTRTRIRSALRKIWGWHPIRKQVKDAARTGWGQYMCAECNKEVKKVEIDHIDAVGPTPGSRVAPDGYTWDEFMTRLFCLPANLRAVCIPCHRAKGKKGASSEKKKSTDKGKSRTKTKGSK
jgi:hypothetical protein